ncbi:MAG: YfhO family protein [Deltaproteobacteria bacterium]|nr:YfhO family protein [Deltaproteobacteria bacterium]
MSLGSANSSHGGVLLLARSRAGFVLVNPEGYTAFSLFPHLVIVPLTGEAKILSYPNTRMSLDVSLNESGVLVLADSFYPGWKVYVDGVEGKIMRANYFFRGVLLSPGSHQVIFRYEPLSFRYGLIVTLVTLLSLLIFFVKGRLAGRRSKSG